MTQHIFTTAPSGRSKCRGCSRSIEKGVLRFGEVLPNNFGDGDMTHWHHPECAAFRRPEALKEALLEADYPGDDKSKLLLIVEINEPHHRLPRLGSAERASSGRARCRSCRELIEQGSWRLPLVFFEEGAYNQSGFIHVSCATDYCETDLVRAVIAHFASSLDDTELNDLLSNIS